MPISLLALERKPISLTRNDFGKKIGCFHWLIILLILFVFVTPTGLFGEEADKESKLVRQGSLQEPKSKSNFVLTIKDNLISLKAEDASLKEIIEEMGHRMKIEVISDISEERKVTLKFAELPLESAIERLREFADIAYIRDSEKKEAKITKILVFPKRKKEEELSKSGVSAGEESVEEEATQMEPDQEEVFEEEVSRPEPFKFEFDPSEFEEQ